MPNRILRDGILTSESVASLGWPEEVFYRRLMSVVDDFGCYYANPTLLRAACYPLQLDKVSDADIGKWLACVQKAALVSVYPAPDGKRYLKLLNFRQQVRAAKSKFPQPLEVDLHTHAGGVGTTSTCIADDQHAPADVNDLHSTCVADAQHTIANAHLDVVEDVDDKRTPQPPKGGKSPIAFKTWLAELKLKAEKPIPPDDPVFDYCEKVGIPEEFLTLHWRLFKVKYSEIDKRQRDWRRVLRNSVRGNWFKVWYVAPNGEATLTTVGMQAKREFSEAA